MVGLSVVLEAQKSGSERRQILQVISKATVMSNNKPCPSMISPPPPPSSAFRLSPFQTPSFLDHCFLCNQKLLPGKDIFMYKGDKGFCSEECRCRQIFIDEEESINKANCSMEAMKKKPSSSSPSHSASRRRKGSKNRAGGFAY